MHADASTRPLPAIMDAPAQNWVDRWAPEAWRPYLRLGRFDRPVGTWLLLFPCWWSLSLAQVASGQPFPHVGYLLLFAIGALFMRASGCAYNDLIDRDIDAQVERTAGRPLASGQISTASAVAFIVATALVGLLVVLNFDRFTFWLAVGSLLIVATYPFAKRVTRYPQFVLGLAFNWGALVGWSSINGSLGWPAAVLYIGCISWTIGYDTIYAHQDRADDAVLGIGSTALNFGDNTASYVGAFYAIAVVLWLIAGALAGAHLMFFFAVTLAFLQMSWQVATLNIRDPANCLWRFRSNRDVGAAIFLGLVADMLLSWFAGGSL